LGVGFPTIVARRRTGEPSFTCSLCKGTITFGGCICVISSFFGTGALTSNGANRSGCTNGLVSIDATGRIVNLDVVSSVPDGFVARTV
jgi:hypothetical protein